jgi:hypothetical protein
MGYLKKLYLIGIQSFLVFFGQCYFKALGTKLCFHTTYHLESGGQIERTNWALENMLKMYVGSK